MFYNTGIGTYVWIVTNRKEKRRKGKIQLVDAREFWTAGGSEESKRSLGDKRRHITGQQIDEIVRLYGRLKDDELSKVFDNADFGYTRVTVERPLRLRYRMTTEDKARFLDACPHLLDDVQAIEGALGHEPILVAAEALPVAVHEVIGHGEKGRGFIESEGAVGLGSVMSTGSGGRQQADKRLEPVGQLEVRVRLGSGLFGSHTQLSVSALRRNSPKFGEIDRTDRSDRAGPWTPRREQPYFPGRGGEGSASTSRHAGQV